MHSSFVVTVTTSLFLTVSALADSSRTPTVQWQASTQIAQADGTQNQSQGPLTLSEAVGFALESNPGLNSAQRNIDIQEGARIQAGLLPNPELSSEVEEFGGNGARSGFREAQINVEFSQLFELGGKRSKRVRVATYGKDVAEQDYQMARLDVILITTQTFISVVAAQERLQIAQDTAELARELAESVRNRIEAGQVSPTEQTRANLELSSSEIGLAEAERELSVARQNLAATWGSSAPLKQIAVFNLDQFTPPEPLAVYTDRLAESPYLVRWDKEINRSDANLAFEKSQRIPDVTVTLGGSRFEVDNGEAVRLGVSVPLPFFNRNQGNIMAAQAQRQLTANQRQQALLNLQVRLNESYTRMASAFQNVRSLKEDILPAASEAYDTILKSYQAGRLSFLDLVQAQRTLLDVREQYMDTLESYHINHAELERFVARQGE